MAGSRRPPHFCLEQEVGVAEGEVAIELELEVGGAVAINVTRQDRVLAT